MSAPPPPPPPPPPPAPPANEGPDMGDMASALFAEINSLGETGARAGLKKGVRGPVNDQVPTDNKPAPKPVVAPVVKKSAYALGDPICSISGKKWSIENQVGNHDIVVEVESMKHTVYVYRCEKSTIQIKGKVNSISIDKCKKVALVFEDALSQVEIVNSDSVQVQCTGTAPSLNIDGCQSVTYYMSQESVDKAMVITSKSAAINLIRPHPDDPDDIVETPIPEQFCTTFRDGAFVTEAVEHDD